MLDMKFVPSLFTLGPLKLGSLLVAFALVLQAQTQMNVQELVDFVRSELALKQHTDKQLAVYLKKVQLTERLTDKALVDLEAQGIGAKTTEALRALRDQSAGIKRTAASDTTYSPATAPDNTLTTGPSSARLGVQAAPPPPPDSVHQQQILDAMRQYAMTYSQSLPNYLCVRVDRRYVDPRGGDSYRSLGTVLSRVSYVDGEEKYKVFSVAGKIVDSEMGGIGEGASGGGGARSTGEFAGMMRSIFEPRSNAEFGWEKWAALRGRTMAVFNYFIDSGHSSYSITYGDSPGDEQHIVTAYKGLIYADANTGEIDRIKFVAVDIPNTFPVREANELVDYDLTNIGGTQQAVLPLRALLHISARQQMSKNEIEFKNYRKFGTESIIKYDMDAAAAPAPEPLPASKTDEAPVSGTPTANASRPTNQPGQTQAPKPSASNSNPWALPTAPPPPPQ